MSKVDIYQDVTNRIIDALEKAWMDLLNCRGMAFLKFPKMPIQAKNIKGLMFPYSGFIKCVKAINQASGQPISNGRSAAHKSVKARNQRILFLEND